MQSGPPGRPHRPQEPRDFDPRQLAADAPHSHSNQPTGRNSPYEQRRPSREDPQSRQNGDRREPERAGAAIPGQGSRNRQSRRLEDPYGRAGSDWATNEEENQADGSDPSSDSTGVARIAGAKGDENDPMGLLSTGILASHPELPPEIRTSVLLGSKAFDPKVFLSTVHPNATFNDLNQGRDRLKHALEERSGALKLLVEAEWDRFVAVKAASETVFEEMRDGGPLAPDSDYGIKPIHDTLTSAGIRAETVFQPIVEARTKAERLKSTLGVFERSKFFFNLPTTLGEAVEEGRYEVALQAYKKGRYLLGSRPEQLLGLPAATTPQQQQQQKRIYEKVWGQVEKIMGDLRAILSKRLRDTKRELDEVEKTIEILLELDPTDDPVWIFFETQHRHIMQLLRTTADASLIRTIGNRPRSYGLAFRVSINTMESGFGASLHSSSRDYGSHTDHASVGAEVWRLILDFVRNLNQVILAALPSFWKVAKGYMEGRYQKKGTSRNAASRRSPAQVRSMTHDIVTLYVSLLSQFFSQPSAEALARDADDPNATPPLPDWVPTVSNATTDSHWLIRVLAEVNDCGAELGALELSGEATQTLKELVIHVRSCFEAAVCSAWIRDAKTFYRLENWRSDPDQPSITVFLRHLAAYQRFMAASAYRIAGGSEELASSCFSAVTPTTGGAAAKVRARQEDALPKDLTRRIQSAFLDGLYAFLDGLVHVAFSDPASIFAAPSGPPRKTSIVEATSHSGRPAEIDTQNVDIRILITVSNLNHVRETLLPRLVNQFSTAFKVDMASDVKMLHDVTDQLDKILFDDYVKRRSAEISGIIRKGVLGGGVDWYEADKPKEVHQFIYDALLSLVLVHAQVSATAKPLVARILGSLVEELAQVALDAFSKVERFGMGGMLQATLEIEFMHQTLSQHVSPKADQTLQSIYKIISQSYYRRPDSSAQELQAELEGLKRTLVASRRATALQFLCFRRPSKSSSASQPPVAQPPTDAPREAGRSRRGAVAEQSAG
ncbi:hypothetical protein BMF94_6622 [Rhodotorula taiwanensis]|uniref:Exocyst complex component SEC5 n=1 Tax=Rhodotorula taiwanensis TaxID=741276 RepID=A0A2S5B0M4_9BASI|nr:hypothetical protein BMF94_6622 [Rhodotorula taiwanensis]